MEGKFKYEDTNYEEVVNKINSSELNETSGYIWIIPSYVDSYSSNTNFNVRNLNTFDSVNNNNLCNVNFKGTENSKRNSYAVRL